MSEYKKSERVAAIVRMLTDSPNRLFNLSYFMEMLNAAKSSISEDLDTIDNVFKNLGLGELETVTGAAGGIRYIPRKDKSKYREFIDGLCINLSKVERIIPGGFLYTADILYTPSICSEIGEVLASCFASKKPDYIVTVETKGIPPAFMTARALGVPLVICKHDNRVTEGSSVSINYISGSTKNIRTMSLSKRSMEPNSKVVIIDDFMKGGGTARGMMNLMKEFNAEVLGIGVVIATREPKTKLVDDYVSLIELVDIDEEKGTVELKCGNWERL
ncbi:pur operon repressor [Calorimonas adulescens]|uniref:Pur operon repressor n=1 Tax=Calorimonas adulescens TaxID=2606906 RepID=A0A5D8QC52_9THEO|nr:pur operon repressor [Calorimonas adulescens]TZE81386.1 pur operon repressor [Calorimonas adulescens]